jgi:hypothetical protein
MDAGNAIGPEGAASLAPALEKMPQLTSLELESAWSRLGRCLGGFGWSIGGRVFVRAVGYALGCDVVWLGYALEGGRGLLATVCEVCAEGRAAMDADNAIGRERAASLAPALEKMPQLTSLDLGGARVRFGRGLWGSGLWCVLLGMRLDAMWCGWGTRLRAGAVCDGLRGVC